MLARVMRILEVLHSAHFLAFNLIGVAH